MCLLVAVLDHQNSDDHLDQVLKWCVDNHLELIEWTPEGNQKGMYVMFRQVYYSEFYWLCVTAVSALLVVQLNCILMYTSSLTLAI